MCFFNNQSCFHFFKFYICILLVLPIPSREEQKYPKICFSVIRNGPFNLWMESFVFPPKSEHSNYALQRSIQFFFRQFSFKCYQSFSLKNAGSYYSFLASFTSINFVQNNLANIFLLSEKNREAQPPNVFTNVFKQLQICFA